MIIYKATNIINGKVYIGKTKYTLENRKSEHFKKAKNPKLLFHKALKKYGSDKFDWEVVFECNDELELNNAEIKFISEYNSIECGYNLTTGGEGGYTFSKDVLACIGKHTKIRNDKFGNPFKGRQHSDKTKQLLSEKAKLRYQTKEHPLKGVSISDNLKKVISKKVKKWLETNEPAMKGKTHSNEAKEAMRKARVDWYKKNTNGFKGKTHTDEVKKQISESTMGRVSPNKDKELSETHKENLSKAQTQWLKNNKHPNLGRTWKHGKKSEYTKVTCPKCGKSGKGPNMNRYHFENCKK
jgi:group I intron endonuclease